MDIKSLYFVPRDASVETVLSVYRRVPAICRSRRVSTIREIRYSQKRRSSIARFVSFRFVAAPVRVHPPASSYD